MISFSYDGQVAISYDADSIQSAVTWLDGLSGNLISSTRRVVTIDSFQIVPVPREPVYGYIVIAVVTTEPARQTWTAKGDQA